jgi:sulfur-carrier protein
MPRIAFTASLERHVRCPPEAVQGATAGAVLEAYFSRHPEVRGYVLDEQGALRHHVAVFVGGTQVRDLSHGVGSEDEVWIMQALSGG